MDAGVFWCICTDVNIPVLQLSLDYTMGAEAHFKLAEELAFLRNKGVLIIGSGRDSGRHRHVRRPGTNPTSSAASSTCWPSAVPPWNSNGRTSKPCWPKSATSNVSAVNTPGRRPGQGKMAGRTSKSILAGFIFSN